MSSHHLASALVVALLTAAGSAGANSWNLEPGLAGVPASGDLAAENTCVACHAGAALNPDPPASLELLGLPEQYRPAGRYRLRFRIAHPGADRLRWGFQLTAVAADTLRGAGRFIVIDPEHTQSASGTAGRTYLAHTYPGTAIGRPDDQIWSFDWVAPLGDIGPIAFFASAVAANADGSEAGDLVYSPTPAPLVVLPGRRSKDAVDTDAEQVPDAEAPAPEGDAAQPVE